MVNVEGRNPVLELLKENQEIKEILLQKNVSDSRLELIRRKCRKKNIRIREVKKSLLDKKSATDSHQGVIALTERIKLYKPEDILQKACSRDEKPFVVILDQLQDPHNFGAIIRTASAAGVHGIIFPADRAAGITPVVEKTSAGASRHLMLSRVVNINRTIGDLKDAGLWVAGADVEGDRVYYRQDLTGALGLVIGSEGSGLRRLVRENCDFLVKIPIPGKPGSLNASVAAGILIFEINRQRECR